MSLLVNVRKVAINVGVDIEHKLEVKESFVHI